MATDLEPEPEPEPEPLLTTYSSAPPSKPPRLPKTHALAKRPLLHPPIPSIQAKKSPQIIYISYRTPFISAVKRVRKILSVQKSPIESNVGPSLDHAANELHQRQRNYRQGYHRRRGRGGRDSGARRQKGAADRKKGEPVGPGVLLKATGKAINKCLSLGTYFMKDDTVIVRVGTGTVDTVDDIVRKPGTTAVPSVRQKKKRAENHPADKERNSEPSAGNITITTTSTKKRKSSNDEDDNGVDEDTESRSTTITSNPSHCGKRPKIGQHTHASAEPPPPPPPPPPPSTSSHNFLSSSIPTPSLLQQQGSQMSTIIITSSGDISMIDVPGNQNEEEGSENDDDADADDDDDDDEEEEEGSDDDEEEEYSRTRKVSMIEIKINLVRI